MIPAHLVVLAGCAALALAVMYLVRGAESHPDRWRDRDGFLTPPDPPSNQGSFTEKGRQFMAGIWRNNTETREGKYLVKRRDGTVPQWPWFVLGAADPAAPAALRAYAAEAERLGMDPTYVADVRQLADWFGNW